MSRVKLCTKSERAWSVLFWPRNKEWLWNSCQQISQIHLYAFSPCLQTCIHQHMHMFQHPLSYAEYTHMSMNAYKHTQTCSHTNTNMYKYVHIYIQITHTQTCQNTLTCTHIHTRPHKITNDSQTDTNGYTCNAHTCMHTQTNTHTHTHTHTHRHTHTHTQTLSLFPSSGWVFIIYPQAKVLKV